MRIKVAQLTVISLAVLATVQAHASPEERAQIFKAQALKQLLGDGWMDVSPRVAVPACLREANDRLGCAPRSSAHDGRKRDKPRDPMDFDIRAGYRALHKLLCSGSDDVSERVRPNDNHSAQESQESNIYRIKTASC